MTALFIALGVFLLVLLVIFHEFGHFIVAIRNGVRAEEFGLGFPPKAWSRKLKSGVIFSLNYLPVGGFVRLKGEHDADKTPGSFGAASLWAKTKIILAGVLANLIIAFLIFTMLEAVGMPNFISEQTIGVKQFSLSSDTKTLKNVVIVGSIESKSPAQSIGLRSTDIITGFKAGGKLYSVNTANNLPNITKSLAGQTVEIFVKRANKPVELTTTLRTRQVVEAQNNTSDCKKNNNCIGYLGIAPVDYTLTRTTWSSPINAIGLMGQITWLTLKGIGNALVGLVAGNFSKASSQVAGPIGVVYILKSAPILGWQFLIGIVGIISLSLAIINVLPIPALDGGRLYLILIPRLFLRRALKIKTEEWVNGLGFVIIFGILLLTVVSDFHHFILH